MLYLLEMVEPTLLFSHMYQHPFLGGDNWELFELCASRSEHTAGITESPTQGSVCECVRAWCVCVSVRMVCVCEYVCMGECECEYVCVQNPIPLRLL